MPRRNTDQRQRALKRRQRHARYAAESELARVATAETPHAAALRLVEAGVCSPNILDGPRRAPSTTERTEP